MAGNWNGGGFPKRKPTPRPNHGPAHELNPRFEEILKESRRIPKNQCSVGDTVSRDTIIFDNDPDRSSIQIAVAAMIMKQAGIPLTHNQYPQIRKFNSEFPDWSHYFQYSGPVIWEHDDNFRYIPGYTRYVIDRHGRVLNAYNGTPVPPEKGGYTYKLVSDGPAALNNPFWVNKERLLQLAFTSLPEDFIDFGSGVYSHDWILNTETGDMGWVKKPSVKVRNRQTGKAKIYPTLPEFVECAVSDYEQKGLFREKIRNGFEGVISIGDFDVKKTEEEEMPPIPKINSNHGTSGAEENLFTDGEEEIIDDFDDIEF